MKNTNVKKQMGLVFTVAVKGETSREVMATFGINIYNIRQLRSEGTAVIRGRIAIIITGVGFKAAQKAAEWIKDHLDVTFVVNLGLMGASAGGKIGSWVIPGEVGDELGQVCSIDPNLPFRWPGSIVLQRGGGRLITLSEPEVRPSEEILAIGGDYVDMECYPQAEVFSGSSVRFHVVKMISDPNDKNIVASYHQSLKKLREDLEAIFAFMGDVSLPIFQW